MWPSYISLILSVVCDFSPCNQFFFVCTRYAVRQKKMHIVVQPTLIRYRDTFGMESSQPAAVPQESIVQSAVPVECPAPKPDDSMEIDRSAGVANVSVSQPAVGSSSAVPPPPVESIAQGADHHQPFLPPASPFDSEDAIQFLDPKDVIVAAAVQAASDDKKKKKVVVGKKRRIVCAVGGMYGTDRRASRNVLTHAKINKFLNARAEAVGSVVEGLFEHEDCVALNDLGDVRYQECVLKRAFGPFAAGECVEIVDWLPSFSTVLISKSGKISETLAFAIAPACVDVEKDLLA